MTPRVALACFYGCAVLACLGFFGGIYAGRVSYVFVGLLETIGSVVFISFAQRKVVMK